MNTRKILLALIALSALAAACHERKAAPRPDYDATRSAADKAHKSLDSEGNGAQ